MEKKYISMLYNSIIGWYEDSHEEYEGLKDAEFIERVCNITGMSEEEYKELMGI